MLISAGLTFQNLHSGASYEDTDDAKGQHHDATDQHHE